MYKNNFKSIASIKEYNQQQIKKQTQYSIFTGVIACLCGFGACYGILWVIDLIIK